jgi:NAD(P) transhydrogenase subunit alpha
MPTFIPVGSFSILAVPFPGGGAGGDLVLAQLDIIAAASGGTMHAVSGGTVDPFVFRFSIFVLAVFVGYFVVWSVTPALHTPLMSVTNAISSVIVVGALLAVGVALLPDASGPIWARALGFIALVFASVNIFGGFLVTRRMLGMYQKKAKTGVRDER